MSGKKDLSINAKLERFINGKKYEEIEKLLKKEKPNLNQVFVLECSYLIAAIYNQDQQLVALFLKYGADPNYSSAHSIEDGGRSPLHTAVRLYKTTEKKEYMEIIKLLLQHGADSTQKDARGETPLKDSLPLLEQALKELYEQREKEKDQASRTPRNH